MFCTRLTNSRASPSFTSSEVNVVSRATVKPSAESTSHPSILCALIVTSSRMIVTDVPFTSVEKVRSLSSSTSSADVISLIRFATALTCLPNFGPITLKFAVAVLRTIGDDSSMNSIALTLISSRMTSCICSMRRRISFEAGIAIRDSG